MAQLTQRDNLLLETILQLSTCQSTEEICDLLVSAVHRLVPTGYVIAVLSDPVLRSIRWRCDRGLDRHTEFLLRLLGKDRTDMTFDQVGAAEADGSHSADTGGKLMIVRGGLYELLAGKVPKSVCTLVRRRLGVGSVHHIAFSLGGKSSGGLAILLKRGTVLEDSTLIEGVARHAVVTIHRLVTEEEANLSARRLKLATKSARIGVWDLDLIHHRLEWDPRMFELYGISPADFAGNYDAWRNAVHPDDLPAAHEAIQAAIRGEREFHTHFRTAPSNGDVRYVEAQAMVLRDPHGAPQRMIGVNWDITERVRTEKRLKARLEGTVRAMSALTDLRDPYMTDHQDEVSRLACAIAEVLRLPASRLEGLRVAALLHDIGKVSVPAEILAKPSKLTPAELGLIQIHPRAAYDVLKNIEFPWPVADIVLQHHERLDGSGYPQGLRGRDILLEARILTAADVVESMCSHRPYRVALGLDSALAELRSNSGTRYDAAVVDACLEVFARGGFAFGHDADSKSKAIGV